MNIDLCMLSEIILAVFKILLFVGWFEVDPKWTDIMKLGKQSVVSNLVAEVYENLNPKNFQK
jgi:hypothetical protein